MNSRNNKTIHHPAHEPKTGDHKLDSLERALKYLTELENIAPFYGTLGPSDLTEFWRKWEYINTLLQAPKQTNETHHAIKNSILDLLAEGAAHIKRNYPRPYPRPELWTYDTHAPNTNKHTKPIKIRQAEPDT